jgi:two-component system chemotaxis response regulator CheY
MKTILVVDDSKAIRLAIKRILESLGFAVAEADDGRRALDYVRASGPPDGILLDIDMPVMDGLSCLKALREDHAFDRAAVVMCTTHNSMEKIQAAITGGANEYIMKPFDQDIIRAKLEQVSLL